MKFFTRPRRIPAGCLLPGDHLALDRPTGRPIDTMAEYVDADLSRAGVKWAAVHRVDIDGERVTITHTFASVGMLAGLLVIARDHVDIDPWTYVRRVDDPAQP